MRFENKPIVKYNFKPGQKLVVSEKMKQEYEENGFLFIRNLFSHEELDKLEFQMKNSKLLQNGFVMEDGEGFSTKMVVWNNCGNDFTGVMCRAERIVDTVESLLGGEVYHYHSKINMKEPHTGGCYPWHQDYGYWYQNGLLFPDQISVFIAIDRTDTENGCLKILRGSHKLGRLEHTRVGAQSGADIKRVEEIKKVLPEIDCVLERGDALFFHSNILHRSARNPSDKRRYCMIACYNRADNDSYFDHHHSRYSKLDKVKDGDVIKCNEFHDVEGKWYMDPGTVKELSGKKLKEEE